MSIRKYTESEALNVQLGQAGWDIVSNATINAHTYVAITVLVGTEVIADNTASGTVSATSVDTDLGDTLSTVEVPEGCTIYGRWSAVTIGANDTAIVYRG
jgi:hypothetical protein|tara:strand:- start:5929 stop:6228 length:300 start_codon:yes stop_codon:yes gene_type:complete